MRTSRAFSQSLPLPPIIPDNLEQLDRAILLLGNRTKNELKPKVQKELLTLVGAYPDIEQAVIWKKELRQVRKDRLSENSDA